MHDESGVAVAEIDEHPLGAQREAAKASDCTTQTHFFYKDRIGEYLKPPCVNFTSPFQYFRDIPLKWHF
jgi:hypothetical protein